MEHMASKVLRLSLFFCTAGEQQAPDGALPRGDRGQPAEPAAGGVPRVRQEGDAQDVDGGHVAQGHHRRQHARRTDREGFRIEGE